MEIYIEEAEYCCENCVEEIYSNYIAYTLYDHIEICHNCSYCGYIVKSIWIKTW